MRSMSLLRMHHVWIVLLALQAVKSQKMTDEEECVDMLQTCISKVMASNKKWGECLWDCSCPNYNESFTTVILNCLFESEACTDTEFGATKVDGFLQGWHSGCINVLGFIPVRKQGGASIHEKIPYLYTGTIIPKPKPSTTATSSSKPTQTAISTKKTTPNPAPNSTTATTSTQLRTESSQSPPPVSPTNNSDAPNLQPTTSIVPPPTLPPSISPQPNPQPTVTQTESITTIQTVSALADPITNIINLVTTIPPLKPTTILTLHWHPSAPLPTTIYFSLSSTSIPTHYPNADTPSIRSSDSTRPKDPTPTHTLAIALATALGVIVTSIAVLAALFFLRKRQKRISIRRSGGAGFGTFEKNAVEIGDGTVVRELDSKEGKKRVSGGAGVVVVGGLVEAPGEEEVGVEMGGEGVTAELGSEG